MVAVLASFSWDSCQGRSSQGHCSSTLLDLYLNGKGIAVTSNFLAMNFGK